MIKKEYSKEAGISLGDLLEKLGVDLKNVEVYDGALVQAINRDKKMVTKIKPVPAAEVVASYVSAPAAPEAPAESFAPAGTIDSLKQPRIELENPKFKVGDLVKLKDSSKLTGIRFGKSRIIGGEWVSGVNFYEIEGCFV